MRAAIVAALLALLGGVGAVSDDLRANDGCPDAIQPCDWVRPKMVEPCQVSGCGGARSEESSEAGAQQAPPVQDTPFNPNADPSMPQVTTVTRPGPGGTTITTTHTRIPLPKNNPNAFPRSEESSGRSEESAQPVPLPPRPSEESSSAPPPPSSASSEESSEESSAPPRPQSNKLRINSVVEIAIGGKNQQGSRK